METEGRADAEQGSGTDDRKTQIRRVAAELFARNGFTATGINELCDAIGLGRGALYYHIGSKEQLLYDIISSHVEELAVYGEGLQRMAISPEEKLRRLSRMLLRTMVRDLPEFAVFFGEYRGLSGQRAQQMRALRLRFEATWQAVLDEGAAAGIFGSSDEITLKAILGMHNHAHAWIDPDGRLSPDEISDVFCDLVLTGLLLPHPVREPAGAIAASRPARV